MTIAAAPVREASKAYRTELSPVSFLRRSASIYADKVAVVQGDRRISSVPLQWLVLHLGCDRGGCLCTLSPAAPPDNQALTPGASPGTFPGRTRPEPPRPKRGQKHSLREETVMPTEKTAVEKLSTAKFFDCLAYLDEDGAARCGLPAEVRSRFTMRSTDGPLGSAMIRCPLGHWFNGPIEFLTWESKNQHHPGNAKAVPSKKRDRFNGRHDGPHGEDGLASQGFRKEPEQKFFRTTGAPAYYLGRPAHVWITAMSRRRSRAHQFT